MRASPPAKTAPSSDLISLHCAQRIAERTSLSASQIQALWAGARTATICDLAQFRTYQRPDTECRITVAQGKCLLLVRSLTTGRLITVFRK